MRIAGRPNAAGALRGVASIIDRANVVIKRVARPYMVQLILRIALAAPFWRSGVLKWDGFLQLNDTAAILFAEEFMLHLPGGPYPFPLPSVVAFLSGSGEIIFPILLVLGLATRFAALGLLLMTAIIQLTVPGGWPVHISWAAMSLAIMARGAGRLSADNLIRVAWGGAFRRRQA